MNFIIFILVYPLIWAISHLPLRVLYLFSDIFYYLFYYVIGYRKKVVLHNIQTAFPDKSDTEIIKIHKEFYQHLTDLVFESIKSFTISKKEITKRYQYKNIELLNSIAYTGKNIALTGSHHNNWELSFGLPLFAQIECFGAYTKINNPYFEKYIKKSRMRFGYDGTVTYHFKKAIDKRITNNIQSLYILLSDQSPQLSRTKYWSNFLGQYVPVHTGADILARKYDLAVIHMDVTKIKRGYYQAEFKLITQNASQHQEFEIADHYLKLIEQNIIKQPQYYLWSHKRFKHIGKHKEWLELQKEKQASKKLA